VLDKEQILGLIPHRPPFLWIDSIAELEAGVRCVALKYVGPDEALFAGHFPGNAILPGVILIEAAAQTAAVMLGCCRREAAHPDGHKATVGNCLLGAVNRFKFLKPVRPGCELRIETRKVTEAGPMAYIEATLWVGVDQVAKGELAVVTS
jgi:3-hydroxyacyl-[acyl-carrier-protein] dehydratase